MTTLLAYAPTRNELVPWADRRGRFSLLRAATFAILLAPAAWLVIRWFQHGLGPEPVNAAIHSTGYWTVWIMLASLAMSPVRALSALPNLVVIRRMVGNAALFYAGSHLALYATDQKWRLLTVASEILQRFYLTIGFVALLGLLALGLTSTDAWVRHLGPTWKRLHRIIYAVAVLGLVHYILQSKLDVSAALVAGGVFVWLMLWRALPVGRDRTGLPLLGVTFAACLLTLGFEYAWYRFGTRIDPMKVIRSEADIGFGLHPAGEVLLLGLLGTAATELRRIGMTAFAQGPGFTILLYALGAFVDDVGALLLGWSFNDAPPDGASQGLADAGWAGALALLGLLRWRLRATPERQIVDAVWLTCVVYQLTLVGTSERQPGITLAALILASAFFLGQNVWARSRGAAAMLAPLGLLLAYEAYRLT